MKGISSILYSCPEARQAEIIARETGSEHAVPRQYDGSFARHPVSGTVSNNAAPTDAPSGSRTINRISRRDQDRDDLIIWP
jgi:hypothetical protein